MQAWGLFESKHGPYRRAIRLLQRAVESSVFVFGPHHTSAANHALRLRRSVGKARSALRGHAFCFCFCPYVEVT